MQFINLYEGYNQEENFRVLICADEENKARIIVDRYMLDTNMHGHFVIQEAKNIESTHYDCDYVLMSSQL